MKLSLQRNLNKIVGLLYNYGINFRKTDVSRSEFNEKSTGRNKNIRINYWFTDFSVGFVNICR